MDTYTREAVEELLDRPLKSKPEIAVEAIENAADESVIQFLIEEHELDKIHDGDRGLGSVRRAVLESDMVSSELKRRVSTRGDPTREYSTLVPDTVRKSALEAIRMGKPVVLYGPTGTGKTTFAKQLALETSIGYTLETASPSWTKQDIIGRVAPEYSGEQIKYKKEPGYVSTAVLRARDFGENYSVIIDELTRADISKIFGPLYTAIENPHQTIFEVNGRTIELDPDVNIICTMNMSDRTVNELDNAITRRFAMIEVSEYSREAREDLFATWTAENISNSVVDVGALQHLFETDYGNLNGLEAEVETLEDSDGVIQFGPMHYEDVAKFVGQATADDGAYSDEPRLAVGEAFRTYIVPRLLNAATYAQLRDLQNHYSQLNEEFDFDLQRAEELITAELNSEQQRIGT